MHLGRGGGGGVEEIGERSGVAKVRTSTLTNRALT